jgi:ankyrin repeat protein
MWSAAIGNHEMLSSILKEGTYGVEATDKNGLTAVAWAAQRGQLESIQVLAEAGANLQTASTQGMTGLMSAAYFGHTEVVQYLLVRPATTAYTPVQLSRRSSVVDYSTSLLICTCTYAHHMYILLNSTLPFVLSEPLVAHARFL